MFVNVHDARQLGSLAEAFTTSRVVFIVQCRSYRFQVSSHLYPPVTLWGSRTANLSLPSYLHHGRNFGCRIAT